MTHLPSGTVTFLFTDIEGSTRLLRSLGQETYTRCLSDHDALIRRAITEAGGVEVRTEGDAFFTVFETASSAVEAAVAAQRALQGHAWPDDVDFRVRMGLHTGNGILGGDDYIGIDVHRAARIADAGHGGQVVVSAATAAIAGTRLPDGVTLADLGEHRLKDFENEHLHQLLIADLISDFPPLRSLEAAPPNLPFQLTTFVGREREVADIISFLEKRRLLTLTGPGGTGKTRLAVQVAAEVSTDYRDGVFFVGFAEIGSSDDIIQTVAESLGVALSGDEDIQTQLLTYLAPRRQLLVFDNLEHLDGAAAIVAEILKVAPHVTVVATSRSKLNLTGETVLSLAGLETTWDQPDEAMQASGAQLFLEAANRSYPGFVLENDDFDALAEILRLTGGMPLGILLAAAWVDMLPIGEIAAEIGKSVDFLETEMGDIPDRQRSIRAIFDYSWALLNPEERDTFMALSVFRGGFSREAAESVAGASLRGLASLVSKSLLTADPDSGRYEVHELLRQYAASELEIDADRYRQVLDAHGAFYADLMGEAPFLMSHGHQAQLLAMVEGDIENIRSAWRHHLATGDAGGARKFVLGLFILYEFRGWYAASIALFNEALELLPEGADDEDITVLRALASAVKGWALAMLSQPEAALAAAAEPSVLLARSSGLVDYWIAVQCLAVGLVYLGSYEEMAAKLDEAIARHDSLDERFWVASLNDWRSFAAVVAGDFDGAARFADEATKALGSLDDYWVTVWNLWLRAMVATHEDRPDDAIELYAEQVARCREVSYVRGTMVSLEGLGEANVAAGRLDAAETAFIEGMAAAEQMGMVCDVLSMMTKVAKVRALRGQPFEAVELLATVLAEPTSVHQPFVDNTPINETASAALSELEEELDAEAYSTARARGSERPYDVAAKELLDNVTDPGRD
jgi:predicted ATPase/class 3 adenylate cyclase